MTRIYNTANDAELLPGMRLARTAIAQGNLVVIPTDTVYGVAADAFVPAAVAKLLAAKGRGRQSPPPVLMPSAATLDALAETVPDQVRALAQTFWPGGLTIVVDAQPSLAWDLGDTGGTVALRVPAHPIALELLHETGPLAVSSANLTGEPAARTATEAEGMLGESVAVYLEAGASSELASTILDVTPIMRKTGPARILRDGAVSATALRDVLGDDLAASTEALS